jgi:hypothetical protein
LKSEEYRKKLKEDMDATVKSGKKGLDESYYKAITVDLLISILAKLEE